MRWQTTDPLGFQDSLNRYAYVHNQPFCYKDPDRQNALALIIPVFEFTFGVVMSPIVLPTLAVIATATIVYSAYKLATHLRQQIQSSGSKRTGRS